MDKTNIYLVDDHAILREGLRHILERQERLRVIGDCGDGRLALDEIERLRPHLVVLDISLPSMSGIEVARSLKRYHPEIKIIMLSRHDSEEYLNKLLDYGIDGYVLKNNAGDDLVRAIGEVMAGHLYVSPQMTRMLLKCAGADKPNGVVPGKAGTDALSNREREVLKLIAEGRTKGEIARLLRISEHTVRVHRMNIMRKLEIHSVTDLVRYAIKEGYVEV